MAAMTAMGQQSALRCQPTFRSLRRHSVAPVQCSATPAQRQPQREVPGVKHLAAGLAAAVLLHSAPADAGVILQKSNLKKVFQSDPSEAPQVVKKAAAKVGPGIARAAPSLPSLPSASAPSLPSLGGGNLSLFSLPLALGGLAAGAFLWKTVDPGFSKFFDDVLCKDNNADGAGYEFAIKSGSMPSGKRSGGTKRVAKKAAKKGEATKKKGLLSF